MKKISIIVPCYNEEETIKLFYAEVERVRKEIINVEIEYIFVNDGSKDGTLNEIKKLQQINAKEVHYLDFSRNFGKESALYAGLEAATGEYIAVMDADLQDPPAFLPEMIQLLDSKEYDIVGTKRVSRKGEPKLRSFFAKCYYKLINRISDTEMVDGVRDFRLMTSQVVDSILELKEYTRFSKGIFGWVGYRTTYLSYENIERVAGESSWSFWALFRYSVEGIVAFSDKPLSIAVYGGLLSFTAAIISLIFVIVRALVYGDPTAGWPSMISIILLIGGLQLLCIGIIGKYISKIFLEVKRRPIYIIREKK